MARKNSVLNLSTVEFTHNDNGTVTAHFVNHIDGHEKVKTYKTERAAQGAATRFHNRVNRIYENGVMIAGRAYEYRKSIFCRNLSPVIVSDNMSGKMENIPSISTSCLRNKFCEARRKDGNSICAHCFAAATLNMRETVGENTEINFDLLTSEILPDDLLPVFHAGVEIARFESFGDIANIIQAVNYINIARKNPHVTFGWWTKNTAIVTAAFDKYSKPDNIVMIQSARFLNQSETPVNAYFDKVFTVYTPAFIADHNVSVNCGARDCDTCRRCYNVNNTETTVNEVLK